MNNAQRMVILVGICAVFGVPRLIAQSTLSDSTILDDFNAVIYNNATTSSDIEGASVVGGNFTGATLYNDPVTKPPAGFGALTVYGNTGSGNININNGGSAYVGGTKGARINFNGGGGYISAPSYTISSFENPLNSLSTSLSQLSATTTIPSGSGPFNNLAINAVSGSGGFAVLNISAAQLSDIASYSINLDGASSFIINVSGSSVTLNANDESGTRGANDIIWNFYQASTVNLDTQIAGTILAPKANVSNENQIDGTLVAESFTGNGELHSYGYTGALPASAIGGSVPGAPAPPLSALIAFGAVLVIKAFRQRHFLV